MLIERRIWAVTTLIILVKKRRNHQKRLREHNQEGRRKTSECVSGSHVSRGYQEEDPSTASDVPEH